VIAGILSALAVSWLWQLFQLPGDNIRVFRIYGGQGQGGLNGTAEDWLGADNLGLLLVGFAMVIAGRKHTDLQAYGIGWIIGIMVLKLGLELFNTNPAGIINPGAYPMGIP